MTPQSEPSLDGLKKKKLVKVRGRGKDLVTSSIELPNLEKAVSIANSPHTPIPASEISFPTIRKPSVGSPRPQSLRRPEGPLLIRHRMHSAIYHDSKSIRAKAKRAILSSLTSSNGLRHDDVPLSTSRIAGEKVPVEEKLKGRPKVDSLIRVSVNVLYC